MNVRLMSEALKEVRLSKAEEIWFPRWFLLFAQHTRQIQTQTVQLDQDAVISFLQALRSEGKKAWQRAQAVRAIEFYGDRILQTVEPDLSDVRIPLTRLAERERSRRNVHSHGGDNSQSKVRNIVRKSSVGHHNVPG